MIRRLGALRGKRIIFGYDRYLLPDLEDYRMALAAHGVVIEQVDSGHIHYLSSAEMVCRAVQADSESFGVLCCGTGMGMSIAANKFVGVRAALVHDEVTARRAREHNHCNVLCLGTDLLSEDQIRQIVEIFLSTSFADGRHVRRIEKLNAIEHEQHGVQPGA